MRTKNILLTGVGGQGVVLASNIISKALFKAGFDVKTSSIKGMSQRLGSVVSSVRFGEKVYSPVVSKADYLLGFELLETLRYVDYLTRDGIGIINNYEASIENYPKDIIKRIKKNNVLLLDWQKISCNKKTINLLFIGILSRHLGIEKRFWIESIEEIVPEKYVGVNLKAFEDGIKIH
jgi:indolepyruvate ferredoxin oxidoreductase beta subunit